MVFIILKNIFYSLIGLASVLSNTMLITILLKFEHLRTTSNIFILNLALCDVTTVLLSIPFAVAIEESSSYPFGNVGCKVLMPAATAGINSAAFTLLLIAIERFYAIIYPMRARMQSCKTKVIVLCVLHGLSIASVIPYSMHQRYNKQNQTSTCMEQWPAKGEQAYTLFLFSIQYVIPLSLIVILYSISWNAIRKQNRVIIKMQRLQQNGCHYSRSMSWDINMRKSDATKSTLDSTGEDSQLLKQSLSAYSFKSNQLEVVDEIETDAKENEFRHEEDIVKQSLSNYSFKSGQLKSVKEDDAADDDDDDDDGGGGGDDDDDVFGATVDADDIVINKSTTAAYADSGNIDENEAEGSLIQAERDTHLRNEAEMHLEKEADKHPEHEADRIDDEASHLKHPGRKKLSLLWNFRPFKSKGTALSHSESFDIVEPSQTAQSPSDEKDGGLNNLPKSKSKNVKRKISKVFTSDNDAGVNYTKVSQSSSGQSSEQTLFTPEQPQCITKCFGHRKGIPQSTSSSALLGFKQRSAGNKLDEVGLTEPRHMTQSKSSPVLASSDSRGTRSEPAAKMSSSETEITMSKFSLLASTARKRLTNAFRSASHENVSLASVNRMKQTRRTLVMFTCVVVVFAICMLPNQITWIWIAFNNEHLDRVITTIFYFLTYTNSILNPWIYGAVNPSFRKAYKKVFLCRKKPNLRKPSRQVNGSKVSHIGLSRKSSEQNYNQNEGMSRFESVELKRGAFSVSHSRSFQKAT